MRQAAVILWLALSLSACKVNVPHPGSIDGIDSRTYDSLLVAQAALDAAKIEFAQGTLPAAAKPVINETGAAYNLTRDAWLTYRATRDAVARQDYAAVLLAAVSRLDALVNDLRKLGVKP
jgi:hypothetical protein